MNLFYKYYTCDITYQGKIIGGAYIKIPFYRSQGYAWRQLRKISEDKGTAQFRRVY
jgi:hypothetical protein